MKEATITPTRQSEKEVTTPKTKTNKKTNNGWKNLMGGLGLLAGGLYLMNEGQSSTLPEAETPLTILETANQLAKKLGSIPLPDNRWTIEVLNAPEKVGNDPTAYTIGIVRFTPFEQNTQSFWEDIVVYNGETIGSIKDQVNYLVAELKDEFIDTITEDVDAHMNQLSKWFPDGITNQDLQMVELIGESFKGVALVPRDSISALIPGTPEHSLVSHKELSNIVGTCEYTDGWFHLTAAQLAKLWEEARKHSPEPIEIPIMFNEIPIQVTDTGYPITDTIRETIKLQLDKHSDFKHIYIPIGSFNKMIQELGLDATTTTLKDGDTFIYPII